MPRHRVVTIADMSSLQVEVDVSESNLARVKVGQPCEIQLDALPDSRFRGAVHMIVPTADRSKASVMVKVRFAERDPRVLPEMSARVAFLEREITREEETPRTAVNPAALVSRNGKQAVFVVKDDKDRGDDRHGRREDRRRHRGPRRPQAGREGRREPAEEAQERLEGETEGKVKKCRSQKSECRSAGAASIVHF